MEIGDSSLNSRRRFLNRSAAGAGMLGLNLSSLWSAQANEQVFLSSSKIKSCIIVFYYGGPSHLDTYDMKPNAPQEIRGEFGSISTTVPGLKICEHLPHMARMMDKVLLVRSMHHQNRLHDSASTEIFTGRPAPNGDVENFNPFPQFFPNHGSVVSYFRRKEQQDVDFAALPYKFHNVIDVPCQGGGFLGKEYDPFLISGDPASLTYSANLLNLPEGLTLNRIAKRTQLLDQLEEQLSASPPQNNQLRQYYDKAYDLLSSERFRKALQIDQEDQKLRTQYGFPPQPTPAPANGPHNAAYFKLRGQNLLLARRLVEAGVPFVNVFDFRQQGPNWDAHADNFNYHKKFLLPPSEQALATLIEDLEQRGLLETTLVVAMGEFGRTPKINPGAGRDHWPDCYSLLLAGGGVKGGHIFGASDSQGAYVERDPVTPADLAATIYWRFGLNPQTEIHDQTGRPWRLSDGKVQSSWFVDG